MQNIMLSLSYLGTRYHGWQSQKNARSVQDTVEEAIYKATGERVRLHGCGRTDAGVHARVYSANYVENGKIPIQKLPVALNAHLPEDIAVYAARQMPEAFHARFSCVGKRYTYTIYNARARDPFTTQTAYRYPYELDEGKLHTAARHFVGKHDFAAFRSFGTPVKDTVRTVRECSVKRQGAFVVITIYADGFLYNMARIIVGTLLAVSAGKLDEEEIGARLAGRIRHPACVTAPACGLVLTGVYYSGFCLEAQAFSMAQGTEGWKGTDR